MTPSISPPQHDGAVLLPLSQVVGRNGGTISLRGPNLWSGRIHQKPSSRFPTSENLKVQIFLLIPEENRQWSKQTVQDFQFFGWKNVFLYFSVMNVNPAYMKQPQAIRPCPVGAEKFFYSF